MKIIIPGAPIAKARHRKGKGAKVSFRGGKLHVVDRLYDPKYQEKKAVTTLIQQKVMLAKRSNNPKIAMEACSLAQEGAFAISMAIYLPIAESLPEAVKNARRWGFEFPISVPDMDNVYKFYTDCARKALFPDDRMLVVGNKFKAYSDNPRVEIEVVRMSDNKVTDEQKLLSLFSPNEFEEFLKDADFSFYWQSSSGNKQENALIAMNKIVTFAHKHADILRRIVSKTKKKEDPP